MPTERLSMRRIRDVLRLKHAEQLSERQIAGTLQISHGVVNAYLQRARTAGLGWPLPEGLDDDGLELLLFPKPPAKSLISGRCPTGLISRRSYAGAA